MIAKASYVRWAVVLWAALFVVAHTQAPLFYSNQNQYFLHGLAAAGYGQLANDWLANTRDPTPVFSALVAFTHRFLGDWAFHAYYATLLVIYFVSLVKLVDCLPRRPQTPLGRVLFLTGLIAAHAAILRVASARLFGADYPWYFQGGLAAQYLLGPGLQPSAFGVFLLASLAAFGHGRTWLAAALACGTCVLHSTYLLPAALLTVGYMLSLWREGRGRAALGLGGISLLTVAPVVAYNLSQFAPTSADLFAEAQGILAQFRIPHHAVIERWLDPIAVAQIGWVALGIVLLRGTRLFLVLGVTALLAAALSVAQVVTGSDTLALMFPWRISTVLVPVATAVILARLVAPIASAVDRSPLAERWLHVACIVVAGVLAAGGVYATVKRLGYRMSVEEEPLLKYLWNHAGPKDVYLIPVSLPKPGRGASSSSFMPAPRAGKEGQFIAVDLQRFRLHGGAALYADFKAIPYQDVEVLEWYRRLQLVVDWYAQPSWNDEVRAGLVREGITHVVAPAAQPPKADFLEEVYGDEAYRVFRVKPAAGAGAAGKAEQ